MSSFLFYLRSDDYIEDSFNRSNIRSWQDLKRHLLSRLEVLSRFDEFIFYYYDIENNRIAFEEDLDYQNAMKVPACKISFGIPINVMVKDKEKKILEVMSYYSDTGFDTDFFESLRLIRNFYATSLKEQTINIIPYLVGKHGNRIELRRTTNEQNIIKYTCSSIFLEKPKGYSDFVLEDLLTRFQWPIVFHHENEQLIRKAIWKGKYSSSSLKVKVNSADTTAVSFPDLEKLTTTMNSLKYFRNVMDNKENNCYSEANRRIIIDILLLAGLQSGNDNDYSLSLCAEKNMEFATSRIGNGPLDYYIVNSGQQIIIALPHRQSEDNEKKADDEDEENYEGVSILESNVDIDAADLDAALPQLLAQMLDAFYADITISNNSRKRTADVLRENETITSSSGDRLSATNQDSSTIKKMKTKKNIVKGMLSTGYHTMFFSLSRLPDDADELPMLEYYGKYSIDVLRKRTDRDNGLDTNDEIDSEKIRKILRAIHCFVQNDFE